MLHQHQQMELVYCNCIRVLQWARHVLFRERGRETEIETETGVPVIILDSMHNFTPLLWFQKDWGIPKTILVNINHNWLKHWEDVAKPLSDITVIIGYFIVNIVTLGNRVSGLCVHDISLVSLVSAWRLWNGFQTYTAWLLTSCYLILPSIICHVMQSFLNLLLLRTGIMCHMWAYFILESAS